MANIRLILDTCTDVFQIIVREEKKTSPNNNIFISGFLKDCKERKIKALKMKVWYISKPLDQRRIYLSLHSSDLLKAMTRLQI